MSSNRRDQFKSSYAAFSSRERDLARSRARRDEIEAAEELAGTPSGRQALEMVVEDAAVAPLVEVRQAGG